MYLEKLVILVKCHKEIHDSAYKIAETDAITKDSESQSFYVDVVPIMAFRRNFSTEPHQYYPLLTRKSFFEVALRSDAEKYVWCDHDASVDFDFAFGTWEVSSFIIMLVVDGIDLYNLTMV
jgi:hypothetical protein